MYADWDFYAACYGGTEIGFDQWKAAARPAQAYIDRLTFGRLQEGWPVTDAVRMAVCAVAEAAWRYQTARSARAAGLKSADNDGYTESYSDAAALAAGCEADCLAAAELHLPPGDPLRYAGLTVRRRRWME